MGEDMNKSKISKLFRITTSKNKNESATDFIMKAGMHLEDDLVIKYLINFQNKSPIRRLSGAEYESYDNEETDNNWYSYCGKSYMLEEPNLEVLDILLKSRLSSRNFRGTIEKDKLFDLLSVSLRDRYNVKNELRRAYPSGGALYPIELLFNISGLKGIQDGIYHYNHRTNSLIYFDSALKEDEINRILVGQNITFGESKVMVIYIYDFLKNYIKYYDISLSLAFIEIGAISQTLQIVAPQCRIGYCDIGGFPKGWIEKKLKLNGEYYHVVHIGIMGGI